MFRHKSYNSFHPSFREVYHTVLSETVENGVTYSRAVSVPAFSSNIPNPEDYRLHDLIDAGVPLSPVSPQVVDVQPTSEQVEHLVNSICDDYSISSENQ